MKNKNILILIITVFAAVPALSMTCKQLFRAAELNFTLFKPPNKTSAKSWMNLKEWKAEELHDKLVNLNNLRKRFNEVKPKVRRRAKDDFFNQANKILKLLKESLEELHEYKKRMDIEEFSYLDQHFIETIQGYNHIIFDAFILARTRTWFKKDNLLDSKEFEDLVIFESKLLSTNSLADSILPEVLAAYKLKNKGEYQGVDMGKMDSYYKEKETRMRKFLNGEKVILNKFSLQSLIYAVFSGRKLNSPNLVREMLSVKSEQEFKEKLDHVDSYYSQKENMFLHYGP